MFCLEHTHTLTRSHTTPPPLPHTHARANTNTNQMLHLSIYVFQITFAQTGMNFFFHENNEDDFDQTYNYIYK